VLAEKDKTKEGLIFNNFRLEVGGLNKKQNRLIM